MHWVGPLAASFLYMHRLNGRVGVGAEASLRGLVPQVQARFERPQRGLRGEPQLTTHVWHGSLGVLLTPGGFDYAGREVSGGTAAVIMVGSQLWPERNQKLPVFMDLAVGVALPVSGMRGMRGMPGIAPVVRAYLGFGWP